MLSLHFRSSATYPDEKPLPHVPEDGVLDLRPPPESIPHSPTASSMFPLSDGTATNVTDMSVLCFQLAALEREVARLREHQEIQLHTAPIEPPPEYYQE